jgi:hypothetical protein
MGIRSASIRRCTGRPPTLSAGPLSAATVGPPLDPGQTTVPPQQQDHLVDRAKDV